MSISIDLSWLLNIIPEIPPSIKGSLGALLIFVVLVMLIPGIIAYLVFVIIGISGFRRLFSYERRESPVHRMHPLPKVVYVFFISIVVAFVERPETLLVIFVATLIPWFFANPSKDKVRLVAIMLLLQFIMTAWSQSFLNPFYTTPAYTRIYIMPRSLHWMSTSISLEGAYYGMVQSLRVMAAISAALLLVTTTHPSDIVYGLRRLKFPYELVFMISITIKAIPSLLEKMFLVIAAERARALTFMPRLSKNPLSVFAAMKRALGAVILAFIPAIIEAIREARRMALAATVKAFRAYPKRTEYMLIPLSQLDKITTIVMVATLVLVILNQILQIIPL